MFLTPYKRKGRSLDPFDAVFDLDRVFAPAESAGHRIAPIALSSDESHVYVKSELPGLDKKDVKIEYHDGVLSISGEKKHEIDEHKDGYHYTEISQGEFSRNVTVGDIDFDQSKAEFKDGVLKIKLPKSKTSRKQVLNIE